MADWDVTIRGDVELSAKLTRASDIAEVIDPALERGAVAMQGDLAHYPPAPATSTYRRTGTLGRAWVIGRAWLYRRLSNNTRYVRPVQDRDQQAQVHRRTGWETWQGTVQKRTGEMVQDMEQSIVKVMK